MEANVHILKIGNSLGIILPSKIIKELKVKEKDSLHIKSSSNRIVISTEANLADPFSAISKGGWFEDTRDAHDIAEELHNSRINERWPIEL